MAAARRNVVITCATVIKGVGPVYPGEPGDKWTVADVDAADADELVRLNRAVEFDPEKHSGKVPKAKDAPAAQPAQA